MGELMALVLVCTMAAAVLFQPALMGQPREKEIWVVRLEVPERALPSWSAVAQTPRSRSERVFAGASDHGGAPEDEREQ
jgi:hypothetical protein